LEGLAVPPELTVACTDRLCAEPVVAPVVDLELEPDLLDASKEAVSADTVHTDGAAAAAAPEPEPDEPFALELLEASPDPLPAVPDV
jgi:hypothetical protein